MTNDETGSERALVGPIDQLSAGLQENLAPSTVAQPNHDIDLDPRSPLRTIPPDDLEKRGVRSAGPLFPDGGGPGEVAVDNPGGVGLQGDRDGCSVDTLDAQHCDEGLTIRRRDGLKVAPQIGLELKRNAPQRRLLGRVAEIGGYGDQRGRAESTIARAGAGEGPDEGGESQAPVVHSL